MTIVTPHRLLSALTVVAACSAGGDNPIGAPDGTVTPQEFATVIQELEDTYLSLRAIAPLVDVPNSGSAQFDGSLAFDISSEVPGSGAGTLRLSVNFENQVTSGGVEDFAVFFRGHDPRRTLGEIVISGKVFESQLDAEAAGQVKILNWGSPGASLSEVNLRLNGTFHELGEALLGVTGSVRGTFSTEGATSDAEGYFAATRSESN